MLNSWIYFFSLKTDGLIFFSFKYLKPLKINSSLEEKK